MTLTAHLVVWKKSANKLTSEGISRDGTRQPNQKSEECPFLWESPWTKQATNLQSFTFVVSPWLKRTENRRVSARG